MLSIRAAVVDDVPVVLELIHELARYERLDHEVEATEERLRQTLFGPRRFAEVAIAEWDGSVAGYALFFHNYSTFHALPGVYLEDLFVRPPFRARGIGRRLLRHLAQLAVERGCARLEWAVLDWNAPAIEFYRRQGAVAMDEWTVYRVAGAALTALAG